MSFPSYTAVADGNIPPSRFVKRSTTVQNRVVLANGGGTGDIIFGISGPSTRNAPYGLLDDGNHAIQGENCLVYGPPAKDVILELGGTVTMGDMLKADSNGKGITTTVDGDRVGARAMASGVAGDLIPVQTLEPHEIGAGGS